MNQVDSTSLTLSPTKLPPGPPEAEVEESFQVTHPPNSRLFPVRSRSNSSAGARPSSLSRLLAQAPTSISQTGEDGPPRSGITPPERERPKEVPLPPVFPTSASPSQHTFSLGSTPLPTSQIPPSLPSPLRPGSRASRLSNASRFSARIPVLGNTGSGALVKGAPTIALTEQPLAQSPSSSDANPFGSPIAASPEDLPAEMVVNGGSSASTSASTARGRTTSSYSVRPSSLATVSSQSTVVAVKATGAGGGVSTFSTLASSLGMFTRRKKVDGGLSSMVESSTSGTEGAEGPTIDAAPATPTSARDLLRRF